MENVFDKTNAIFWFFWRFGQPGGGLGGAPNMNMDALHNMLGGLDSTAPSNPDSKSYFLNSLWATVEVKKCHGTCSRGVE